MRQQKEVYTVPDNRMDITSNTEVRKLNDLRKSVLISRMIWKVVEYEDTRIWIVSMIYYHYGNSELPHTTFNQNTTAQLPDTHY